VKNINNNLEDTKEKIQDNKFEFSLFKEEDNIVHKVLRVKRISNSKEEKWKIFEDNKVLWVLDGEKLSLKEKNFLRTVDGMNLLLSQYKKNETTISAIKKEIKKYNNK